MVDGGPFGPASVVVFGLFSALSWGTGDFAGGLTARRISVFVLVFFTQLVGMIVAGALWVLRGEPLPGTVDVGWSVLSGAIGSVGILALYAGLAHGRMGVVAPVTGVLAAVVPVTAGIVLDGVPATVVLVGIAAAIVAVILVSRVPGEEGSRSGIELAILAGLGIGLFNVTITRVEEGLVFGPLVILRLTATALVLIALATRRQRPVIGRRLLPAAIAIGVLDMAGNAGFIVAEQTGELAVASILSSLYPVVTVILAAVVLREPVTRSHAAGIGLALLAIALIAAGSG